MGKPWEFELDELHARVAWSRIAEPRDRAAAVLVAGLGAPAALRWAAGAAGVGGVGRTGTTMAELLAFDPAVTANHWMGAVARWKGRLEGLDPRRELSVIARLGGRVLVPGTPDWPESLSDLGADQPHCLWVRGDASLLAEPGTGLVGSRACTPYGKHVTGEVVPGLIDGGRNIISGGAYGIDAAAHQVSLDVGGTTVAVMAGGLDRFYPSGNDRLLQKVAERGVVVGEAPPGTSPMRQRFLSRNRLIAALAEATVVVEAPYRSGALSTANHAMVIGRPVGAIPGPVTSMASAGCHRLLRDGAQCVSDAREILQLTAPIGAVPETNLAVPSGLLDDLDERQAQVLDALPARASADIAALVRASGLAEAELRGALGYLELDGRVRRDGTRWARSSRRGR